MLQEWFYKNIGKITPEVIEKWFVYNEKEPLLFNTGLFLGLFIIFYTFYISLQNTFYKRLVYVIAFSLFFYLYKSLRNHFNQSRIKTLLKYVILNILTIFLMAILMITFFMFSLFNI